MKKSLLCSLQDEAANLWESAGILGERIDVTARTLSVKEAIGDPESDDFPLQRGKERLMEASFRGARGQAFTDTFGDFAGSLREVVTMDLGNNFRRAIFVATLNAVQRSLGEAVSTIHCRDKGPSLCAPKLAAHISEKYGKVRITQIGYQPKMIEALAKEFSLRVIDLDPDNIGSDKYGVAIEAPEATAEAIEWAELLVVTGSTLVNETMEMFLGDDRPTLFFGTTVAGAASIRGLQRFCCESE